MRIFFIPGLGEEKWIFDKIAPYINGEKVFIDNFILLNEVHQPGLNILHYADLLIEKFAITKADVVIGHSLGGWVAFYIKFRIDCPIIQIASFTDVKKAFKPANRHVIYWLAKNGIGLNEFVLKMILFFGYRNEPSKDVVKAVFKKMMTCDKNVLVKQLQIIYNPLPEKNTCLPEVRMHARRDHLVLPPDESFFETPGDHFALYTYPTIVYNEINRFLQTLYISQRL